MIADAEREREDRRRSPGVTTKRGQKKSGAQRKNKAEEKSKGDNEKIADRRKVQ